MTALFALTGRASTALAVVSKLLLGLIVVLVVISRDVNTIRLSAPASLGQPYRPDG